MQNDAIRTRADWVSTNDSELSSIRVLAAAVIERAARDAVLTKLIDLPDFNPDQTCYATDAIRWLRLKRGFYISELIDIDPEPFSFVWCCQTLDLDPLRMQQQIRISLPKLKATMGATSCRFQR